ncbi:MAG: S1 family peptidase [Polyangiales bacterium]
MGWTRLVALALLGALSVVTVHRVVAQRRAPAWLQAQAARATVKIVALADKGRGRVGAGVLIDQRGFVLTCFHLVGYIDPRHGMPGTLLNRRNVYHISAVDAGMKQVRPRWVARVVRADVRHNLALLQIVGDLDGKRLSRPRFSALALAFDARPARGWPLFAFGYVPGSPHLQATTTEVGSVQENAVQQPSWLQLRRPLPAGMQGAGLLNAKGQLLALALAPPARNGSLRGKPQLGRAVHRVPRAWRQALARGEVAGVQIQGVERLSADEPNYDMATGDSAQGQARHFYRLPRARPIEVRVEPALPLELWASGRRLLRRGEGSVRVAIDDPARVVLAVQFDTLKTRPLPYSLAVRTRPPPALALKAPPATAATAHGTPGYRYNPFFTVPRRPGGAAAPMRPTSKAPTTAPRRNEAELRAVVVDALTERPLSGASVWVAREGSDVRSWARRYLAGTLSEGQLRGRLVGWGMSDAFGQARVPSLARRRRYRIAVLARGHRPAILTVSVGWLDGVVDIGQVQLTR